MSEVRVGEGHAVVEEIIRALGDTAAPESRAWWQYLFVVNALGDDSVRQLVREVAAVEAAGGMTTQDGSRRRTPGGVFFVLAYEALGPKRTKSVRWRADRRFHEGMLQRFLQLIALVVPASASRAVAGAEAALQAAPRPVRAAKTPVAPAAPAGKPAKRRPHEAVEVVVVRRRPDGGGSAPAKPGPTTPRAAG